MARADGYVLVREYLWKYRKPVTLGLLTLVLVDALESLPPLLMKSAVDTAVARAPDAGQKLWQLAAAYLGVAVIQSFCRYGWRIFLIRSSILAGRDLRIRFAHHVFGLAQSFFDRKRIGELMSLVTSDVEAVRMAIGVGVLVTMDAVFYFLTVPVAMFWLSPKLALLAFATLPVIPFLVFRNEREVHVRFEQLQEQFSHLSSRVAENLGGIRVVKGFAREDQEVQRFSEAGREYVRRHLRLARVQASFGPTLDFAMSVGLVLLLWVGGGALVHDDPALTLGTFVAFQRYVQKMVWPMAALGMSVSYFQKAASSTLRLQEVLNETPDVRQAPVQALSVPEGYVLGAPRILGRIEMRGLKFTFPGASAPVLGGGPGASGLNLTIEPGERVAFVGAVGSGKSALLALLPRLYPLPDGMLFVDGVDVNHWPLHELRRHIGYVSQEVFLFSESVQDNVAYGLSEREPALAERASLAEPLTKIEEAARLASVHEEVLGLSERYDTRLGERGINLSGGQKQRLTIARAIAKSPSILVLDDALSSVDVEVEERILQSLRARPGRNTELVVAHRISTVRDADRIVVLENGVIRQLGTHSQLALDRRGSYARYYEQQRQEESLAADLQTLAAPAGGPSP